MTRRKTHAEFVAQVETLVGDEYKVLGVYVGVKKKIKIVHYTCDFTYEVRPDQFLGGSRCPKCSGKMRKSTSYFYQEVKALVGDEYTFYSDYKTSHSKMGVVHAVCGNQYETTPNSFLSGNRCPYCASNSRNTLRSFKETISKLVGSEYTVLGNYVNSQTNIKMKHVICNSEYEVKPNNFIQGNRCPQCSTNKKKDINSFTKEVKEKFGDEYTVLGNYVNAHTNIEIRHNNCGIIRKTTPTSILSGKGCYQCFGPARKTLEKFKEEVFELVGKEYKIIGAYVNTHTKIKINHTKCNEEYTVTPHHFLMGTRCPKCFESKGEVRISNFLANNKIKSKREVRLNGCADKSLLRFDFSALNHYSEIVALIEYDGEQHYKAVEYFGGESELRATQRRDAIKTKFCADNGIPLIRIPYWDFDNIETILTEKLLPLLKDADKHNAS